MGNTHYYYALNRKAAERVFDLTWNQFLEKFGWSEDSQWESIGDYLSYCLGEPSWEEEPTPKQIAPTLRRSIRATLREESTGYYCILELSYQLGKRSFVRSDINAEDLEEDLDGLNICAVRAFLSGDIDDRTLWCIFTLNEGEEEEGSSDLLDRFKTRLTKLDRRRILAAIGRFGPCEPLFEWQPASAVLDGHTVLCEEDTRRFVRFVRLAWRHNWPAYSKKSRLLRFRNFKLARKLHAACPALLGNCLVHYCGP